MLESVQISFYVGRETVAARDGWLRWPEADIEAIAAHVLRAREPGAQGPAS
jgi:hypothetical protein